MILALTDLVESVMEVAVIVTVLPTGTTAGAVYVVVAPLPVCVDVKTPQALEPQATVQFTPADAVSLLTIAFNCVAPLTARVAGGAGARTMDICSPVIVHVTLDQTEGSLVELA